MEFWSTIVGLMRRKAVIIPTLLVALALGVAAYVATPVSYTSSTLMVLTTTEFGGTESQDPSKPTDLTNPMLNFNESLTTTSAILIQAMNTQGAAANAGVRGSTRMIIDDGSSNPDLLGLNGPFLYIRVQSATREEAKRVVVQAQALMRQKLRAWQSAVGAPEKTYVSLVDVVAPTAPAVDNGRAKKLGVMAFLCGFLLCLASAYFIHQRRVRRRARDAAAPAAGVNGARALVLRPFPEPGQPAPSATAVVPETVGRAGAIPVTAPQASAPQKKLRRPVISRSLERRADPPMLLKRKKKGSPIVRAPVKANVRSRNR